MTDFASLSPAAQAVMNGLWDADLDDCQSIEDIRRRQAAAALRAAADQLRYAGADEAGNWLAEIAVELERA